MWEHFSPVLSLTFLILLREKNVMKANQAFCLSGVGYVQKIKRGDNYFTVQIKAVTDFDASRVGNDEVWIDCIVENTHSQVELFELLETMLATNVILIQYKALYEKFNDTYFQQHVANPGQIVFLRTTLDSVKKCYVNGCLFEAINNAIFIDSTAARSCQI
jgi:hypothetical protein